MKTAVTILCPLKGVEEDRILVELFFLDRHVDPDNVLPHNPSGTNVEMPRRRIR